MLPEVDRIVFAREAGLPSDDGRKHGVYFGMN